VGSSHWPFDKSRPIHFRTPLLFAYSPGILPRPNNWDDNVHVTGYFFLEDNTYQPPDELQDFLSPDNFPLCISFGSMVNREAEQIIHTAMDAINKTNNAVPHNLL
jgi:sterol 3beta-glucosyltransferase